MKRTKWLALFAVMAMVIAACGTSDDAADTTAPGADDTTATTEDSDTPDTTAPPETGGEAGQGGQVTLTMWQAASTLNPFLSGGTKELLASSLILEPLAEYSPQGELVPALAADIPTVDNGGVSEDLTSITWTLAEGALWSDGTPVTADDVIFTHEYCTETPDCTQSSFFDGIASIEAVDESTVTINFEAPVPYPYSAFVSYQSPVIQKAQFENCVGADAVGCTEENFAPIGTGPYVVTEFLTNDTATYEVNPNYRKFAEGKPFFGEVLIIGGGDAEASARSVLELGEADYGWNLQVDPTVLNNMEAAGIGVVKSGFAANVERLMINQTNADSDLGDLRSEYDDGNNPHPFLTDQTVVNALSMAIDRTELNDIGYGPGGQPTCNVWPIETETAGQSSNLDECLVQDVEGANALLDEAGYIDNDGDGIRETPDGQPLFILFQTSTNAVRQTYQELIKDYWSGIGVDAELKNVDASVFFGGDPASPDTYQRFFADIEMYTNGPGGPDAQAYMSNWTCGQVVETENFGGSNIARYCNPEYDALQAQLLETADFDERKQIVIQLNDMLSPPNGTAMVPLTWRASVSAFANTIQGSGDLNGWDSEYWNIEDWTRSE